MWQHFYLLPRPFEKGHFTPINGQRYDIHFLSRYSGGQMKFNKNNISFGFSEYTKSMKKCNIPLKSPIKSLPRMQKKNLKFSTFGSVLGPFLKKLCFWKMGVAGMKRGPCPLILHSFFMEPNEEALLKVSLKNFHWFQSCKTPLFQKLP